MTTAIQKQKIKKEEGIENLRIKAGFFDELLEFIEDKYFGHLMNLTEKETNIPLSKVKKLLS